MKQKKFIKNNLNKLKKIKLIITDVDGVLTDGKLFYDNKGNITKSFNIKDGQLIKFMQKNNFKFFFITGRKDELVKIRAKELNINGCYVNIKNKIEIFEKIKQEQQVKEENILYIGDDYIDLEVLKKSGISVAPKDAIKKIKKEVDYITRKKGGEGVLREIINLLIKANNIESKLK